jgi:GH43 family beta-xylosidase
MTRTYTNPVHPMTLGDPFVLRYAGCYYAYGTAGGAAVPVLRSRDLVAWDVAGTALEAERAGEELWAPEVAYSEGRFHLYCSAGGAEGEAHALRAYVADHPEGPFRPAGAPLFPDEPFTIDAHPYRAPDGTWYLYFSRDFLEGERPGTGIVVSRLVEMHRAEGGWHEVVRPHADWQIYERSRRWYGRVWDWYTVEGPAVRRHGGRLWCLFSGGGWRHANYGLSFATAAHPLGPWTPADAPDGPPALRTVPGEIVGRGTR